MLVDLVQRGADVSRLIPDDLEPDTSREVDLGPRHVCLDSVDDLHGVGADLTAHLHEHRRHTVQPRQAPLFLGAVLRVADVADPD